MKQSNCYGRAGKGPRRRRFAELVVAPTPVARRAKIGVAVLIDDNASPAIASGNGSRSESVFNDHRLGDRGLGVRWKAEPFEPESIDGEIVAMGAGAWRRARAAPAHVAIVILQLPASCRQFLAVGGSGPLCESARGGRKSVTIQWKKPAPPVGASGSWTTTAKLLVPSGGSLQMSSGETFCPLQPRELYTNFSPIGLSI